MRNNLKALRKRTGQRQSDVAEALGLATVTYQKYEQGRTKLSDELLVDLAIYFGCTVDEILGAPPIPRWASAGADRAPALRRYVAMVVDRLPVGDMLGFQGLVEAYEALSSEGRGALADYADTLVRSGKYAQVGRTGAGAFRDADPGDARERESA